VNGLWTQLRDELASDPFLVLAFLAALVALASTPLAFAVLGRLGWFRARRGRVIQRPAFSSIVSGTLLVMGIPAIFAAVVVKSRSFDRNRYEFDPNRTWSILEQGRGFPNLQEADTAIKYEMQRLALERKNLVETVKRLDEAVLALRGVADTSPSLSQRFPQVLEALARVRKSIGLDGPQQLLDSTAPPVDLRRASLDGRGNSADLRVAPGSGAVSVGTTPGRSNSEVVAAVLDTRLSERQVEAELATVPEPQRKIASMLPLSNVPPGWTVGKSGDRHLETFNADNLYEKIDGRAESFVQYGVRGMAYTFYHPSTDQTNEVQLYIFELGDSLKALGKYGSEKPSEFKAVAIGDEGYTSAGSTLFYAGRFYTQIVSTQDSAEFAAFSTAIAARVAERQKPGLGPTPLSSGGVTPNPDAIGASAHQPSVSGAPVVPSPKLAGSEQPASGTNSAVREVSPITYFRLLPTQGRQGDPKYVAQDVFGYSFLADVFMADYKDGDVTWQGFIRPYHDKPEAKSILEKYVASVKKDGGQVKPINAEGADEMVVSDNIGLVDVVFRKGNTLAGANGGTSAPAAEAFARSLAKSLPAALPTIQGGN
jgi:hypothetical protein